MAEIQNFNSEYEKKNFILKIQEESKRLELCDYLTEDRYLVDVFLSFTKDEWKIKGLEKLKSDFYKVNVINSIQDEKKRMACLKYVDADYNKIKVINKLSTDELKMESIREVKDEAIIAEIILSLEDDHNKELLLEFLSNEQQKVRVLKTIKDENVKFRLLEILKEDNNKLAIAETFTNPIFIYQMVPLLTNDYSKRQLILRVEEESKRLELCDYLTQENYLVDVFLSFTKDEWKIKGLEKLKSDFYKVNVINSIQDEKKRIDYLKYVDADYNKIKVINKLSTDELKMESIREVKDEAVIAEIILSLEDDHNRELSLEFLSNEQQKVRVLKTIKDENVKFRLLGILKEDNNKLAIAETFTNPIFIYQMVPLLTNDYSKRQLILRVEEESKRLELCDYLTQENYLVDVFLSFTKDEWKIKGLEKLKSDFYKVNVINSIQDEKKRIACLKYVENDHNKIKIIKLFTDDKIKIYLLDQIHEEDLKAEVILTLSDESIKYKYLDLIKSEYSRAKIIGTLKDHSKIIKLVAELSSDSHKEMAILKLADETLKFSLLDSIKNENYKVEIIKSLNDFSLKTQALSTLKSDQNKMKIINAIEEEEKRILLLDYLTDIKSKIIVISFFSSASLKVSLLKKYGNYEDAFVSLFESGEFDRIVSFDLEFLSEFLDSKKTKLLKEYKEIPNAKIKNVFSNYVSKNHNILNENTLDNVVAILLKISTSNSSEVQSFGDSIANVILNTDNPIQTFSQIEEIFVKNTIPYIGKVFQVFKVLHPDISKYANFSPVLNRFLKRRTSYSMKIMDLIIFNDLLKCSFGSNNRGLRNFLEELECGNEVLLKILNHEVDLSNLSDWERQIVTTYLDKLEIIFNSYEDYRGWQNSNTERGTLEEKVHSVIERLGIQGKEYQDIPDKIVKKFCGIAGIESLKSAKNYLDTVIEQADHRNRQSIKTPFTLEEGDFVKGLTSSKYFARILQNGSVSKEFLGDSSGSDATTLDTDLSRILPSHLNGLKNTELGKIIGSTISAGFGPLWIVLKNDPNRITITRDSGNDSDFSKYEKGFLKLEAFQTLSEGHYGIRTGFASSEISYIITDTFIDRISLEVVLNGFYIPIVNTKGELVFTPDQYDNLREKMSGLSYYNEKNYHFSDNLVTDEVLSIVSELDSNKKETLEKSEKINALVRPVLEKFGLSFKQKVDGDLSEGIVEFLDTGSTGRGTNKIGDGDFDFMMRLDRSFFTDKKRLDSLQKELLDVFHKQNTSEITGEGDFRLKKVKVDEETELDIDITFIEKTDKITYSTDMAIKDMLNTIKKQSLEKYHYIVANIILAKKVLSEAEAYKPNRGDVPQGGMGGVGVENWILQNGGSFIDAAIDFLKAAEGKNFEQFKESYSIWNFGENFMAQKRNKYPHDNYVRENMSEAGYEKMIIALKQYLKKNLSYELNGDIKIR